MRRSTPLAPGLATVFCLAALIGAATARAEEPYTHQQDVPFAETDGAMMVLDIFRPTGATNGLAVVDIASGAWFSDRGKIRDHKQAQIYDIMCKRGCTVFAVRPGSVTRYSALEMVDHVHKGIRWVKAHKDEYGIDPDRVVLCGASAGGHLTCLSATTATDGDPQAKDPLDRLSSRVKACVAFFPPTDFSKFAIVRFGVNLDKPETLRKSTLGKLLYPGGATGDSREQIERQIERISPAKLVTSQTPPTLLIHGDADPIVPLEQSKIMLKALQDAGVASELIIKKGGGHPWPTIHEEVAVASDWIEKQMGVTPAGAVSAAK